MLGAENGLLRQTARSARVRNRAQQLEVATNAAAQPASCGGLAMSWRTVGTFRWLTKDDDHGVPESVLFVLPANIFPRSIAVFIVVAGVYAAFFSVVAFSKWQPDQSAHGLFTTVVFTISAIIAAVTLFAFFQLVFSDPGVIGADNVTPVAAAETTTSPPSGGMMPTATTQQATAGAPRNETESMYDNQDRLILAHRPYCTTCRIRRPVRASHCSVCHVCVAQHDHHCGITGSCVGRDNIGAFLRFTGGLALSCDLLGVVSAYLFFASDTMHFGVEGTVELCIMIVCVFSAIPLNYGAWYTLGLYSCFGVTLRERRREMGLYSLPAQYIAHTTTIPWSEVPRPYDGGCCINVQAACGCAEWPEARKPEVNTESLPVVPY